MAEAERMQCTEDANLEQIEESDETDESGDDNFENENASENAFAVKHSKKPSTITVNLPVNIL